MAKKLKIADITIEKVKPSGAYKLTHFQDGAFHSRQYIGYSKKEALKMHRDMFGQEGK